MKKKIKEEKILIGRVLQNTRKSLGLTQERVSEQLGLAARYISDIERDKTKGSLDTLVKLCNIYQVSPTYILKDYIKVSDFDVDNTIVGFYNLNDDDKDVVRQLIHYMNKKNTNTRKKNKKS